MNVFGQASRTPLSGRSGLAFPKEAQLAFEDCKFGPSTIQANEYFRKDPDVRFVKTGQSWKMHGNLCSELAQLV